jgi:hypothetical protein
MVGSHVRGRPWHGRDFRRRVFDIACAEPRKERFGEGAQGSGLEILDLLCREVELLGKAVATLDPQPELGEVDGSDETPFESGKRREYLR